MGVGGGGGGEVGGGQVCIKKGMGMGMEFILMVGAGMVVGFVALNVLGLVLACVLEMFRD